MLSIPGRNGRRRRVMNEEVLSASSTHTALRAQQGDEEEAQDAPRYSDAAGVEHHPQVTDFIPRRYGSIAIIAFGGVATVVVLSALHYFAMPVAMTAGWAHAALIDFAAPGSLSTWVGSMVLIVAAASCLLIYSLRRHRVDDFRGRYRVWLAAAVACVLLSANSVVGLHDAIAQTLSYYTGWWALRAGAVWWLTVAGLPLAWIAMRAFVDVRECRLSAVLLCGAIGCYAVGVTSFLGFIPAAEARVSALITGAATLLAHWLLLAAVVTYARYVVLDAQGLIEHRRPAATPKKSCSERREEATAANARETSSSSTQSVRSSDAATQWIDGSRAEREHDDEDVDDDRKMSKSDRKRLRKLKARDRAA